MQRDFDLVVTILGAFRDAEASTLTGQEVTKAVQELAEGDLPAAMVEHHLEILADAGLAKKLTEGTTGQDAVWRITWKGYDALEQDDEDEEEEEEEDDLDYDEE